SSSAPTATPGTSSQPDPTTRDDYARSQAPARDDKDDSGRVFEIVWSNAEAGFSYISLASLNSKNLELKDTMAPGALFGFGAGLRLLIFTLGFRARLNDSTEFTFW